MAASSDHVSVGDLFSEVWKSNVTDYAAFLLLLNVENSIIKRNLQHRSKGEGLADCLEFYINNVCVNWTSAEIWQDVARAIEEYGNAKRAEEIREQRIRQKEKITYDTVATKGQEEYIYYLPEQIQQEVFDTEGKFKWLKTSTTMYYSEAVRKIRELCRDVTKVLNEEEREASNTLRAYKVKGGKQGNECKISLSELSKRISRLEKLLSEVKSKLSDANCTAFSTMKTVNDEYAAVEELLSKASKQVDGYSNLVSKETDESIAKAEDVIQSLQGIMRLTAMTVEQSILNIEDEHPYEVVENI